jgi:uroporphyrinogen decarboxylase
MQTGREAITRLMRGERADHIPVHDSPWGDTLQKWVTQGMPTDEKGHPVNPVEHFGFDMAGCGGWWDWHPRRGVNEVVEETDAWRIVRNGSGALLKWWKHRSGTPEHIGFHLTSREVWDREYRPLLAEFDRARLGDIPAVAANLDRWRAQGKWTVFGHQFIWENMRASMGDYTMYTSLLTDPGWIHDFNRVYTDLWKECYRILIEEGGKPDGVWVYEDLGYRDRLFCRPEVLEALIFPYYRELVEFLHGYGLPVVLHSCGYQEPMIPLAIQAGFDALNPMEAKAGNDLLKYAEQYGDRLAFVGGLDARILETGDREVIRKGVTDLIQGMKARGARWVYGSDHSLSTNIDYDAFRYSLAVYREQMSL